MHIQTNTGTGQIQIPPDRTGADGGIAIAHIAGKGRGIVALVPISAGDCITEAPVIALKSSETLAPGHPLFDYLFAWPEPGFAEAIALGPVSLINHDAMPNASLRTRIDTRTLRAVALRHIAAGEEITIDYDCALWFTPTVQA